MKPSLSVIVCTYNRCESLRQTLQSLSLQQLAGATAEIIVVDNNSTDATASVVEELARVSAWSVRYVFEPRQGIAFARNRGLEAATGEYAAFLDDDVVACPGWAQAMVSAFEETPADLIGGRIDPLWLASRPAWLSDDLMGPVVTLNKGIERKWCKPGDVFLTANCGLRRSSAARYGLFDVSLGRRGTRWVGGEDFDLCRRWQTQGAQLLYEPTAMAQHKVMPERLTPDFYRHWFRDIGYTQAHQLPLKWHHALSIMPLWRWGKLAKALAGYASMVGMRRHADARLRMELWWRFERAFLRERGQGCIRGIIEPL
ncbi:MAG: glycosyltransferase, partial [Candidatus Omnitrophica bacterium]|nr:glycosyltransferase [Candidatus Omnitrophota bacterium]